MDRPDKADLMMESKRRERLSRLLIVEDDVSQLRTLTAIMREEGFDVIGCGTAAEALEHVKRETFAVAVVDQRLPDLSGTQLLEEIHRFGDMTRVIINTAHGTFDSAKEAVNLGAFAYVEKASSPDELIRHVHSASRWHLDRYAGYLEDAVQTRTAELQEANEELKREITERERAERALRESEERYRSVVEDFPGMICRFRPDAELTFVNDEYCRFLGKTRDELIGAKFTEQIPAEERESVMAGVRSLTPDAPTMSHEHQVETDEGGIRWQRWTNCAFFNSVGEPLAYQAFGEDITKQKQMTEQLRQSQKMDAIGQLAGGVAHDFNNMLHGIIGYAQLLILELSDNEELLNYAQLIKNGGKRAAQLTEKLLAFSRKGKLQSVPVDVHNAIDDALSLLERSIDRRINVVKRLESKSPIIIGDPSQIQNVILNLGINARDAMPSGGMLTVATADVELDPAYCGAVPFNLTPGNYLHVTVSDSGLGMSKEVQSRIFEPYFTTKTGEGTGLGLAAVYGIVTDHQGSIMAYSEVNRGTAFHIHLPVDVEAAPIPKGNDEDVVTGSGCCLVVDDEATVRNLADRMLTQMGYEVILAKDGLEGVDCFRRNKDRIDIVILDMVMPRMDGSDCFNAIREMDPEARVILTSGFTRDELVRDLMSKGLVGFLKKPYMRAQLSRALAQAVRKPASS